MQNFLNPVTAPPRRDRNLLRQLSVPRMDGYLTGAMDINPKKWRKGYSPNLSLPELLAILPPTCKKFFALLDRELERVEAFYKERENEAIKRFDDLQSQWKELSAHKVEFQVRSVPRSSFAAAAEADEEPLPHTGIQEKRDQNPTCTRPYHLQGPHVAPGIQARAPYVRATPHYRPDRRGRRVFGDRIGAAYTQAVPIPSWPSRAVQFGESKTQDCQ